MGGTIETVRAAVELAALTHLPSRTWLEGMLPLYLTPAVSELEVVVVVVEAKMEVEMSARAVTLRVQRYSRCCHEDWWLRPLLL